MAGSSSNEWKDEIQTPIPQKEFKYNEFKIKILKKMVKRK